MTHPERTERRPRGVPETWRTGRNVLFRLGLAGEPDILEVRGTGMTQSYGSRVGLERRRLQT